MLFVELNLALYPFRRVVQYLRGYDLHIVNALACNVQKISELGQAHAFVIPWGLIIPHVLDPDLVGRSRLWLNAFQTEYLGHRHLCDPRSLSYLSSGYRIDVVIQQPLL